ncbi:general odorant-binding protein 71 isoform X1 [Bombus terrestris]|uniref:General odorant-binding protein 71 isoform X1 n=1 Tax=Bombus terrestris TaxID=30195 RepID=A0A9C6W4Z1_BOMTE|nr:general odorant-binding protein 71 isoform X1 [Bombus terrestris]
MKNFISFTLCCILLFFLREGVSLRCRSGNQQIDVQFQKVLKTCRNRYASSNTGNGEDSTSTEDKSSGSDSRSEEEVYDNNFFDKNDSGPSYNQSTNNQRYRNSDRNSNTNTYSSDHSIKGNVKDFQNIKHIRKINDRDSWNSRDSRSRKSDFNNGEMNDEDTRFNNNTDRQQDCIVQCFFNELNAVDQKGFPEKDLVIPLMIQSIQDPELKDFVEESIIECFRYLEANKREKCEYSQNLLTCLAEKGQQKCEDWEN